MTDKEMEIKSPIEEKLLIIFHNVPSNYSIEDIIRDHLPSNNKSISNNRIEKMRKFIIVMKIDKQKCLIIYSSIYQWLKHARFLKRHENTLPISIYPQSLFDSAQNCSNITFKVKYNEKIINLMHIIATSYVFHSNNNIYLSFKQENQEYLLQIENDFVYTNDKSNQIKCTLNEPMKVYQYYTKFDRYFNIKPNLKSNEIIFINQSRFYVEQNMYCVQQNANGLHLLHPIHCVMQQQGNIKCNVMFTNYITLKFERLSQDHFIDYAQQMYSETDLKSENENKNEYTLDFKQQYDEIKDLMEWFQGEIGAKYAFPMLAKLLNFKNPALFADIDVITNYKCEIEAQQIENGIASWIIQEAMMKCKHLNAEKLSKMIEEMDEKYDAEGVDVYSEDTKEIYFQIKISRFGVNIDMIHHEELKKNDNFNQFRAIAIRRNIYITTFDNGMKNIRNIMNLKGYQLISQREDLFLRLNDDGVSYISAVCDECFSYDTFRDKFKQIDYFKDIDDDSDEDDNDNDIYHQVQPILNDIQLREPPFKKRKMEVMKKEKQNDIIDSSPKTEIIIEKPETKECKASEVHIAYGVPIYSEYYYDCGEFPPYGSEEFDMKQFALQCISTACRSDLELTSGRGGLRNIGNRVRNRSVKKPDEAEAAFLNISDNVYNNIFISCFTRDKARKLDINLKKWKKRRRKYIIYEKQYYIDKKKVNTLMTLLNLYAKYNSKGILYLDEHPPPWYKPNVASDLVATFMKLGVNNVNVIDLTNVEWDENDNGNYYDTTMKDEYKKPNGIKMEYEYETCSDSKSD